jgi:glycosyltransferase involved in cell wall biosynthesis
MMLGGVSVVISTYSKDRLSDVIECVESIERQKLAPKEIILVLDPDQDLLNFYKSRVQANVRIVLSHRYGLSEARNAGTLNSTGEIIAFVDDDAIADPDWLKRLAANYEESSVAGVGGYIKPLFAGKRPSWFPDELDWIIGCSYRGLPEHKALVRNPIGCNMSFRRTTFAKAGLFRSDIGRFGKKLLAGEEADFSSRVLRLIPGAKIVYDPSAIVYHRVPKSRMSLRYALVRSFFEGLSKGIIVNSHQVQSFSLSSEKLYLKHLLRVSVPSRLRQFYKVKNLIQLIALFLSASAVYGGFLLGILRRTRRVNY